MESWMKELREISKKIVEKRKQFDDPKYDNYELSTDIQTLKAARDTIRAEHPFTRIDHPNPETLPPFLKRTRAEVLEIIKRMNSQ